MKRLDNPGVISSNKSPSQILIGKNYEKFKDLITYLRLAKGSGIRFVFIGCDHLGLIKELRERYKVVLPRERIVPFEVEVDREIESLYRLLKDELKKASITDLSNIVIFVYGLDKSILPYKECPPFLATLNLSRDLFRNIPCPIVLCLSIDSLTKIATYAPDFWSWRGTVIEFEPVLPVEVKGAPEVIPAAESKVYRDMSKDIRMYEEMVKEYKEVFKEEDVTLANLLFELAMRYGAHFEFRKAIGNLKPALVIFKKTGNIQGEAKCYGNLGNAHCSLGDFKQAIEYYSKSLNIVKEIGDKSGGASCYTNLGVVYRNLGDFKQAIDYHSKSLEIMKEIGDIAGEASCYTNLGAVYQSLGDFNNAIDCHSKSLNIMKGLGDKSGEASCYTNLGIAYDSLGDFKKAIDYHSKSLEIMKEIGDRSGESRCYTNLGNAYYSLGDFMKAIEYHSKSLEIKKEIGDRSGESRCYTNLGNAYDGLGDLKKAIDYHFKSLEIAKDIGDRAGEARCYTNLGNAYDSLGDFMKAIDYHSKSLEIAKEIGDRTGEARCYGNLGIIYNSLGDFKKVINYHSKSLEIMKETEDRVGESIIYGNLGWVYYKQKGYQMSLNYIKQSLRIINLIKEELPYEDLSLYFLKSRFNTYELGIASALMLYGEKGHDKIYLLDALEIVERIKSRELVKQLGMKKKELQLEKEYGKLEEIEYEIVCLNRKGIRTEEDRKRVNELYEQKAKLQQEIYNKSLDPSTITPTIDESIINTFWEKLGAYKNNSSVLEMSLHQDKILYFLFDEAKYEIFAQKITDDLVNTIQEYLKIEQGYVLVEKLYRDKIIYYNTYKAKKLELTNQFYKVVDRLTNDLFPKELSTNLANRGNENLFIIPHRWLHRIPFEAMVIDDKPLSIKYNLSRHYSLDLLRFSLIYPDKADDSALIISNPTKDLGDEEGIAVKDALSVYYNNIKFLNREKANLRNVENELPKASLIHFDCHGVFNLENPLASKLLLSDQALLASDIALTELTKYPIVFLNACESGEAGDRKEKEKEVNLDIIGDEQIGFVRAFNLAKTPTIIVTYWRVNIEVAAKFAKYFYQELLTNKSTVTQALKIAREKVYDEYKDKSRDWATYRLYGNPFKKLRCRS